MSQLILTVPGRQGPRRAPGDGRREQREVVPNVAYFINDLEGNPVELYTLPKS